MLTQEDLKAIDKLIEKRIGQLEKKIDYVEKSLMNRLVLVEKRITEVEDSLESKIEGESLEIQKEITFLKYEMKKEFKKVHSDQNLIIKHFNQEFLGLRKKVDGLEQKTGITNLS